MTVNNTNIWLCVCVFVTTIVVADTLVIRKCCPLSQRLSENGTICADTGRGGNTEWGYRTSAVNVKPTWNGNSFPWWIFDGNTSASELATSSYVSLFTTHAEDIMVEYGSDLPCSLKFTTTVPTSSGLLFDNGSLYFPSANILVQPGYYCADQLSSRHVYLTCAFHDAPRIASCCTGNDVVVETYGKVSCLHREDITNSQYYWQGGDTSEQVWAWDVLYRWCYYDDVTDTYTLKDGMRFAYSSRADMMFRRYYTQEYSVDEGDQHFGQKLSASPYSNISDHIKGGQPWYFTPADVEEHGTVRCGLALRIEKQLTADGYANDTVLYKYTVLRCPDQGISQISEIMAKLMLYTGTFFISIALVTFAVVPESRNRKSTIVVCYVVCMLLNQLVQLAFTQLSSSSVHLCYLIQFLYFYVNWAAAFNMNVLCFDIARTFRILQAAGNRNARKNSKRMLRYMLYSWGVPLLLLSALMAMVFTPGSPHSIYFKEDSHHFHCYIGGYAVDWAYVHGPEVILSTVNAIFVMYTVARIIQEIRKTSAINDTKSRRRNACRKRFWVLFNLSCMVGPSRMTALIVRYSLPLPTSSFVFISNVANSVDLLRQLSIFVFVCCKMSVLKAAQQRLKSVTFKVFTLGKSGDEVELSGDPTTSSTGIVSTNM